MAPLRLEVFDEPPVLEFEADLLPDAVIADARRGGVDQQEHDRQHA